MADPGRVVHNLPNGNFLPQFSLGADPSFSDSVSFAPYIPPPTAGDPFLGHGWATTDMPPPDVDACPSSSSSQLVSEGGTLVSHEPACFTRPNQVSLPHSSSGLLLSTPSPSPPFCVLPPPAVGNFMPSIFDTQATSVMSWVGPRPGMSAPEDGNGDASISLRPSDFGVDTGSPPPDPREVTGFFLSLIRFQHPARLSILLPHAMGPTCMPRPPRLATLPLAVRLTLTTTS